jgi:NAD(P)-dependent dehydrogenase (short-subunit alcohol dehydrogenase family)
VALMGWLAGKTARLVGDSPAIAAAFQAQGARLVTDADCDVLVHVAAPPSAKPVHELSHDEWRAALDAGLDQRFVLARDFAAARRAVGKGGAVVNLTKTLGVEWARDGIRVNAVLTFDQGETLGNLVAYLASDYAAYVTGAVMGVGLDDG